nr:putative E3 ubiquitin-protein ligase RF298 [Ipomoea batatas]
MNYKRKFQGLWQCEEREKTKLLEKAESIRRERQERKQKTKIEEEKLIAKGEENRVLCTACNVLHQSQGMKDCPLCRMPIKKRIQARFVPPN